MKKFTLYTISLVVVLALGLTLQNMLSKPILKEFNQLKQQLAKIEESSLDLDFKIQEKSSQSGSDLSIQVDSLKKVQAGMREDYKKLRGELVHLYENGQPNFITSKMALNSPVFLATMGGLALLGLILLAGVVRRGKKKKAGKPQPGRPAANTVANSPPAEASDLERLVPINGPEISRSAKPNPQKEPDIQTALRGLSEIALQTLNSGEPEQNRKISTHEPQSWLESSDNHKEEAGAVQVSHFVESEEPRQINSEAPEVKEVDVEEIVPYHILDNSEQPQKDEEVYPSEPDNQQKWHDYQKEESKKIVVLKLARKGSTVSEISQRLKISKTEIELMIRSHNMNG